MYLIKTDIKKGWPKIWEIYSNLLQFAKNK